MEELSIPYRLIPAIVLLANRLRLIHLSDAQGRDRDRGRKTILALIRLLARRRFQGIEANPELLPVLLPVPLLFPVPLLKAIIRVHQRRRFVLIPKHTLLRNTSMDSMVSIRVTVTLAVAVLMVGVAVVGDLLVQDIVPIQVQEQRSARTPPIHAEDRQLVRQAEPILIVDPGVSVRRDLIVRPLDSLKWNRMFIIMPSCRPRFNVRLLLK